MRAAVVVAGPSERDFHGDAGNGEEIGLASAASKRS